MRYPTPLFVLLATGFYTSLAARYHVPIGYSEGIYDGEMLSEKMENNVPQNPLHRDEELEEAMNILRKLLILPWPNGGSPLVYVDSTAPEEEDYNQVQTNDVENVRSMPEKRMRYYRKYPWKRQNVKYDPDSRFVCVPTKNEVHQLLVALHKSRYGNKNLSIDFCNRKRPAYSVFTNIHYLG